MIYRICKQFEVESGHMLSKHPERCRFPHGHTRRVEVVVEARDLDDNDMVVDFKALKLAVAEFVDRFDHAMCVNLDDPLYPALEQHYGGGSGRVIGYADEDPTTEVMAREIFAHVREQLEGGQALINPETGTAYEVRPGLKLRRVRLWETTSSWGEVEADD